MRASLEHLNDGLIERGDDGGVWRFSRSGLTMYVIASWGAGWDHVSVSMKHRCPSWEDMCWVKERFFDEEECVVQYHPPKSEYVNNHARCLHMWRPQNETIPIPPAILVGIKGLGEIVQ